MAKRRKANTRACRFLTHKFFFFVFSLFSCIRFPSVKEILFFIISKKAGFVNNLHFQGGEIKKFHKKNSACVRKQYAAQADVGDYFEL